MIKMIPVTQRDVKSEKVHMALPQLQSWLCLPKEK